MKKRGIIFLTGFLLLNCFYQYGIARSGQGVQNFVTLNLVNDSIQSVNIQIMSQNSVSSSYPLQANRRLKLKVNIGDRVKIVYKTSPYETLLSGMGSLNELNRTIYLKNDSNTIFVQEKYFGERIKGKGTKRIKRAFISNPEEHRINLPPGQSKSKRKYTGPQNGNNTIQNQLELQKAKKKNLSKGKSTTQKELKKEKKGTKQK